MDEISEFELTVAIDSLPMGWADETNARDPRQGTPLAKAHSHTPVTATLGVWGVVPTTRTVYGFSSS